MTFWGLSSAAWSALTAIGTIGLALVTVAAVLVTLHIAKTDRERDDERREQDRQRDAAERRELAQRFAADQRAREDFEASQVLVGQMPISSPATVGRQGVLSAPIPRWHITVSTLVTYPIRQPEAEIAHLTNSGPGISPSGHAFLEPTVAQGLITYGKNADVPSGLVSPAPIVRFTDPYGHRYYIYKGQAMRFDPDTDWMPALQVLDLHRRTGPSAP